jgi:hypothetical protein
MTEAEWLASTEPGLMLRHLGDRALARNLRLLFCGQPRIQVRRQLIAGDSLLLRLSVMGTPRPCGRPRKAASVEGHRPAHPAHHRVESAFRRRHGRRAGRDGRMGLAILLTAGRTKIGGRKRRGVAKATVQAASNGDMRTHLHFYNPARSRVRDRHGAGNGR